MRTNQEELEKFYIQSLDNDIIEYLAEIKKIDIRLAMDIYYRSLLCKQIHNGDNGIQYLDYKYLAEDLIENEKELVLSVLNIKSGYIDKSVEAKYSDELL